MDFNVIIISHNRNIGGIKSTINSVKISTYNRKCLCVVGEDISTKEFKEISGFVEVHKAKNTFTSLINTGIKKNTNLWSFVVFAGSRMPLYIEKKLDYFCKNDQDVLFPVVDRKWNFVDGSFNGVLINNKFFKEVGDFPDFLTGKQGINDFELAKMIWAVGAIEKGCKFKAIVGMKII